MTSSPLTTVLAPPPGSVSGHGGRRTLHLPPLETWLPTPLAAVFERPTTAVAKAMEDYAAGKPAVFADALVAATLLHRHNGRLVHIAEPAKHDHYLLRLPRPGRTLKDTALAPTLERAPFTPRGCLDWHLEGTVRCAAGQARAGEALRLTLSKGDYSVWIGKEVCEPLRLYFERSRGLIWLVWTGDTSHPEPVSFTDLSDRKWPIVTSDAQPRSTLLI